MRTRTQRWWHSPYISLVANAVGLALAIILAAACLNAAWTGEIGFGKSSRLILEKDHPTTFWLAFWFQFGLATIVVWLSPRSMRKDIRAIRELRAQRQAP